MQTPADPTSMNSPAFTFGAWAGGFFIMMIVAYVLLGFASSPKRKAGTAATLRVIAIIVVLFLAYAGYTGSSDVVNPGSVLGVIVTIVWAAKQQFVHKKTA